MSGSSPGHRRLVLVLVDEERGRAVNRSHHGLEAAALEFVGRYLAHRRGGAAIAAAAGRAHCGRALVARRRRDRSISAAAAHAAAAAAAARASATTGRSVRHEPCVHNVSGRFSEKIKTKTINGEQTTCNNIIFGYTISTLHFGQSQLKEKKKTKKKLAFYVYSTFSFKRDYMLHLNRQTEAL